MKLRKVLRRMNKIDKAVLLILALTFLSGVWMNTLPTTSSNERGTATVFFKGEAEDFGKEALPGSPVADQNEHEVGYVYEFSPREDGVLLTLITNADFEGAVGDSVFLRGKHFVGTGKIKSFLIGAPYDSR